MPEASVRWFHMTLPVVGDAEPVDIGGVPSKFWVVECEGGGGPIFRTQEIGGKWSSIQERLEWFARHDSNLTKAGIAMFFPKRVVPANPESTDFWLAGHQWIPELRKRA